MLFFWSCPFKNISIPTPRYFIEFDGYNLFPVSLIFISSGITLLGDINITSLVFLYYENFYLLSANYSDVLYDVWLAYFWLASAKWCNPQYWIALWRSLILSLKLSKEVFLRFISIISIDRQIVYDLTSKFEPVITYASNSVIFSIESRLQVHKYTTTKTKFI